MSHPTGRRSLESKDPTFGDRAVSLYAELGSMDKVAAELRCGSTTISRLLKRRGIVTGAPGFAGNNYSPTHVKCPACGIDRYVNVSRGFGPYCQSCKPIHDPGPLKLKCGTVEGVQRHREFGHPLCKPCRIVAASTVIPEPTKATEPELPIDWDGPEPVIEWRKGRGGILRGVVKFEPHPDLEYGKRAAA